jgi:hypothetical protein
MQARSHGHAGLTERLEGRLRVMELQQRTAEALAQRAQAGADDGGGNGHAGERAAPDGWSHRTCSCMRPCGAVSMSLLCHKHHHLRVWIACVQHGRSFPVLWSGGDAGGAAAQLQESPVELADLYNDYAAHFQVRSAAPGAPFRSRLLHRML